VIPLCPPKSKMRLCQSFKQKTLTKQNVPLFVNTVYIRIVSTQRTIEVHETSMHYPASLPLSGPSIVLPVGPYLILGQQAW